MKILKWFLIVVLIVIAAVLSFLWYLGVFSTLKVSEREMGPFTIAYKHYVGEYKDTGKVFMEVSNAMKDLGLEVSNKSDSLGIYYDNPATVAKDKLRSDCGIVIAGKDLAKAPALLKKGLKVMTIGKKPCVVAEFPIRNVMSFMVGPAKGYPALAKYAAQKNHKAGRMYEFYDMKNNLILFTLEIAR
ncbi:MAG: hypothetical protein WC632_05090 [Candidatus Margulisiibacteriota bacterium]